MIMYEKLKKMKKIIENKIKKEKKYILKFLK